MKFVWPLCQDHALKCLGHWKQSVECGLTLSTHRAFMTSSVKWNILHYTQCKPWRIYTDSLCKGTKWTSGAFTCRMGCEIVCHDIIIWRMEWYGHETHIQQWVTQNCFNFDKQFIKQTVLINKCVERRRSWVRYLTKYIQISK